MDVASSSPLTQTLEGRIARFVVDLDLASLSRDVRQAARWLMQDQLGLQIGCASLPWSLQVLGFVQANHTSGKSRITGSRDKVSAGDAAFVNGSYGHGFEYDDAHRSSSSHPGSCVVPAALSLGEEIDADMGQVLLGMVAGYEVYTRIGMMAAPELLERGWHPHEILSNFGAAAVAAKMLGLDFDTTVHALSIAMSHCAGTTEYTSSGGSVKRIHAGIGTYNGLRAARMAQAGITGPTRFMTGRKGFLRTFLQKDAVSDNPLFAPNADFQIEKVWIKPHCCCGCNHAYIDAARQLAARVGDISSIVLGIQTGADVVVGNKNEHAYSPQTIVHVQYSLPVQVALSLLGKGNGFEVHQEFMQGRLDLTPDSLVMELARRVKIVHKPELDSAYPGKWVGDVEAILKDGSTVRIFVEDPIGTAENPVTVADRNAKFRDLTRNAMGDEKCDAFLRLLSTFPDSMPASQLTSHLAK